MSFNSKYGFWTILMLWSGCFGSLRPPVAFKHILRLGQNSQPFGEVYIGCILTPSPVFGQFDTFDAFEWLCGSPKASSGL